MVSFLDGQAATYMLPYQGQIATGVLRAASFWSFMDARYEDVHRQKRAGIEYDHWKQGNKPFMEFITELERLSSEAGYDVWPSEVKISKVESKLCSELRQLAITGITSEDVKTYEGYVRKLHDLDNRLKSAKLDGAFKYTLIGGRPQFTSSKPSRHAVEQQTLSSQSPSKDPDSMDWTPTINKMDTRPRAQAVSKAELEARKAARACFTCGNKGHRSRDCYYAPPLRVPQASQILASPPKIKLLASSVVELQETEDESSSEAEN